jgi:hypothetical protein
VNINFREDYANPLFLIALSLDPDASLKGNQDLSELINHGKGKVNSVILAQQEHGKSSTTQDSNCLMRYIQEYLLEDKFPPKHSVCPATMRYFS